MWSTRIALALLFLQPIAFFRHVLINPKFHIPWDIEGFHLPLMAAIARTWRQGEWPWWNPLIYCGYPLHADVQAQVFYPPAWVVIAVRNWTGRENILYSLEWMVVLHMALAGLLMFWLLRRMEASVAAALFGGTVFQVGPYFASQTQHVGAVCAAAWLPLAWLAVHELRERWSARWLAALAFALAMSFLSGFMATTVIVYAATGLFALAMVATGLGTAQLLVRLGAGIAWSIALVAVLLWPALELTQLSFAKLRSEWGAGVGGIPFVAWWGLLWPDAVGVFTPLDPKKYTLPYNFTFLYLYCGLGVVLAAIGVLVRGDRRMRIFLGIALAFLVLGAGDRVPGLRPLIELAPRAIRGALYVEFSPAAMTAALAVMGGLAITRLKWQWAAWAVAIATMVELHWAGSGRPMNTAERSWRLSSSETNLDGSRALISNLKALVSVAQPPLRMDMLDLNFNFSMAAPLRPIPAAGGDSPFAPVDVLEMRREFAGGNYWERSIPVAKPESPWLDFLNVGVLVAEKIKEDPAALEKAGWEPVEGGEWMRLYRNTEVRPRCYAASKVRAVANEAEAKKALAEVDFRDEVVVEGQAPAGSVGPAEVRFESYRDNEVVLRVKAVGPALVVCSETLYPGWRATIDDRETPILRTNRAFRGIAVPAGDHRIRMAFTPTRMYAGGVVTLAAMLAMIAAIITDMWRGR